MTAELITPQAGEISTIVKQRKDGVRFELSMVNSRGDDPSDQIKPFVWQHIDGKVRVFRAPGDKIIIRTTVTTEEEF